MFFSFSTNAVIVYIIYKYISFLRPAATFQRLFVVYCGICCLADYDCNRDTIVLCSFMSDFGKTFVQYYI